MDLSEWDDPIPPAKGPNEQYNHVEITNIPKKIDAKTLTSLVVGSTRIVPKKVEICFKVDPNIPDYSEQVALLEYNCERDAILVVQRMGYSPFAKTWRLSTKKNPKMTTADKELLNKWSN